MKLCRFDLASAPGTPRSGIVYEGKVYETDGTNPVGVHDWTDAHLLAPVGQPSSVRLFEPIASDHEREAFDFIYLNPGAIVGPHGSIPRSESVDVSCIPSLGLVVAGGGANVPVSEADGLVLGLTLVNVFYHPSEAPLNQLPAWAFDAGIAVGPALTTPDELDALVVDESSGRRYGFEVTLAVNGEERGRVDVQTMGATMAELLSFASLTTRLRQGDLIAAALMDPGSVERVKSGDQVKLTSDKLGALVTKLA